jgi:multiple sugar transport system permease protein
VVSIISLARPKLSHRDWIAYALLAPYVIYAIVFWVYPFAWGVQLSSQNWVLPGAAGSSTFVILSPDAEPENVGLDNFSRIFGFYVAELHQRQDDSTGELLFVCERQTVPASEIDNYEEPCVPRYESVRDVVPSGSYREWFQFDLFGRHYAVTAELPLFWNALWVAFKFMLFWLPMVIVGPLFLAMLLQRAKHFQGLFIAGYLSSYVISGVAYSAVFRTMFARGGLVDEAAYRLLGTRVGWFSDPQIALFSIAMIVAWKFIGYYGLIFLSGLNAIPREVYEAAKLDGASAWKRFWRITIPLLNPSFVVVIVFGTILSFNIFTEPFLITGGTPIDTTNTFMLQIYRTTFEDLKIGLGAAMAIVMAVMSFATMTVMRRLVEREVTL